VRGGKEAAAEDVGDEEEGGGEPKAEGRIP